MNCFEILSQNVVEGLKKIMTKLTSRIDNIASEIQTEFNLNAK
jgi:hypothetical protein